MLELKLGRVETFDEDTGTFSVIPERTLRLEHSLASVSKWEAKFKKPFMGTDKTPEELMWYAYYMILCDIPPDRSVILQFGISQIEALNEYIGDSHTATTFGQSPSRPSREIITAELIYYWMTAFNIPFECERWNLNRLMTLIRVCSIKQTPPKKMSSRDSAAQTRALNARRRAGGGG